MADESAQRHSVDYLNTIEERRGIYGTPWQPDPEPHPPHQPEQPQRQLPVNVRGEQPQYPPAQVPVDLGNQYSVGQGHSRRIFFMRGVKAAVSVGGAVVTLYEVAHDVAPWVAGQIHDLRRPHSIPKLTPTPKKP